MKRKNLILFLSILPVIILLSILIVFALNNSGNRNVDISKVKSSSQQKSYKTIGIVSSDMQNISMANVASLIKEKAKENDNIKILLYDSEGKNDKQILQLEELINLNVDGIILNPTDKNLVNKGIEEVRKANIPIISISNNVSSEFVDSYIGSDLVQVGELQGKFVASTLHGRGNIIVLSGEQNQDSSIEMLQGLKNILQHYPELKVLEIGYCSWDKSKAAEFMGSILKKHLIVDAVISENDEMILESLNIINRFGQDTLTVGVGAIPEAIETIAEGQIDATIYQDRRALAISAYDTMMKILKKEHVDKMKLIPYETVTSKNVNSFLSQNFTIKK